MDGFTAALARVRAKHPQIDARFFEGKHLEALRWHYEDGCKKEYARIQGIDALIASRGGVPADCAQLVRLMKWDGRSTAADVAEAIGPASGAHEPADRETVAKAAESLWERVPAIREEFPSNEAYAAYKVAETHGQFRRPRPQGLHRTTAPGKEG